jgi:hypothetical protein
LTSSDANTAEADFLASAMPFEIGLGAFV